MSRATVCEVCGECSAVDRCETCGRSFCLGCAALGEDEPCCEECEAVEPEDEDDV